MLINSATKYHLSFICLVLISLLIVKINEIHFLEEQLARKLEMVKNVEHFEAQTNDMMASLDKLKSDSTVNTESQAYNEVNNLTTSEMLEIDSLKNLLAKKEEKLNKLFDKFKQNNEDIEKAINFRTDYHKRLNDSKYYKEDPKFLSQFRIFLNSSRYSPEDKDPIIVLDWYEFRKGTRDSRFGAPPGSSFLELGHDKAAFFGKNYMGEKYIKKSDPSCGGCWFTNDRTFEKVAHGILIDNTNFPSAYKDIPHTKNRKPEQYWFAWHRESATKGFADAGKFFEKDEYGNFMDDAFNYTVSYRRDSDIPYHNLVNDLLLSQRYNSKTKIKEKLEMEDGPYMEKLIKNKFDYINDEKYKDKSYATWIVSNCQATVGARARMDEALALKKAGLKFDGFGKCWAGTEKEYKHISDEQAPGSTIYTQEDMSRSLRWRGDVSVLERISKYKFYLSFENGIHCRDYLSEKFWRNSLEAELVPIVFGVHREDIKALAPPNSYIHIEDYPNRKDLIDFLDYLNSNDTAYMEYHQWRTLKPDFTIPWRSNVEKRNCGICQLLKENREKNWPKRMIRSVTNWWWINNHDDKCLNTTEIPENLKNMKLVTMEENWYDELQRQ